MRTRLLLLFGATVVTALAPAFAAPTDDDGAVVAACVPGVRRVLKTSSGYSVETTNGTCHVYGTAYGYRFEGSSQRPNLNLYRTANGFRAETGTPDAAIPSTGVRRFATTASGYSVETTNGTRRIFSTAYGYTIEGAGQPRVLLYRTSTGYSAQDSEPRAPALRATTRH